ncbi:MAG: HDOD domain-containing protein [Gallionellaceae bacterium]|jgi:HD-like signal output (HDOD) protein
MNSAQNTRRYLGKRTKLTDTCCEHRDLPQTMGSKQQAIVVEVLAALDADQLDLPVLPEMVFKIQELRDDPNSSNDQFVELISTDLALSLYLIKAANSAAFFSGQRVGSLQEAIPRLGHRMLYSMVMNLTLTKLFIATSPLIKQKLKELWARSRIVAANCYVLAQKKRYLKPEDAMLAGLVCEIGALPLYLYADRHHPELDPESLDTLISTFSSPISFRLLQSWNFPDAIIDVVADKMNMRGVVQSDRADYVDVVMMANLQAQTDTQRVAWTNVFAAERLGCYPGDCKNFFINNAKYFEETNGMLNIA